jgi:hypothetical protein
MAEGEDVKWSASLGQGKGGLLAESGGSLFFSGGEGSVFVGFSPVCLAKAKRKNEWPAGLWRKTEEEGGSFGSLVLFLAKGRAKLLLISREEKGRKPQK